MASPTSPKPDTVPKSPASPYPVDKAASPRATSPASPSVNKPGSKPASPAPGDSGRASPAVTQPVPAAPVAFHSNPKIAELQTVFPSVDVGVIEMVLESVGGSQDRAIESLLQMTDPNFKPDELASVRHEESNQVDLDAEFARAIALQDEEEVRQQRREVRLGPAAPSNASRLPDVLPYQPRVRKARRPAQDPYGGESATAHDLQERYDPPPIGQNQQGDLPPGLMAFEEKVTAIAETGRQTFNRFFNTAKAKYADYQAQQAQTSEQRAAQQALREAETPRHGGLWGETPGRTSLGSRSASQSSQGETPVLAPTRRWHPSDSFEEPPKPVAVGVNTGRRSPGPAAGTASPEKAAAGKIDLAKLGFLPKKRVDLMSTSPQPREDRDPNPHLPTSGPTTPTTGKSLVDKIPKTPPAEMSPHTLGDSDDDDDLDYTENPFDRR